MDNDVKEKLHGRREAPIVDSLNLKEKNEKISTMRLHDKHYPKMQNNVSIPFQSNADWTDGWKAPSPSRTSCTEERGANYNELTILASEIELEPCSKPCHVSTSMRFTQSKNSSQSLLLICCTGFLATSKMRNKQTEMTNKIDSAMEILRSNKANPTSLSELQAYECSMFEVNIWGILLMKQKVQAQHLSHYLYNDQICHPGKKNEVLKSNA